MNTMGIRKTTNTGQSVLSQLERLTPSKALCEYVWNALDAGALNIHINAIANGLSGFREISISDDGTGIVYKDLDKTFGRFLDSQKKLTKTPITRGKKGKGRFSFVKFCDHAEWLTWNSIGQYYSLKLLSDQLDEYFVSPFLPGEKKLSGTKVSFSAISISEDILLEDIIPFIQNDISWLLLAHTDVNVFFNGERLSPVEYRTFSYSKTINELDFAIKTVQWALKPVVEKSYIYFLNSDSKIVYKELSDQNGKQFYSSSYVSSSWFDTFEAKNDLIDQSDRNPESEEFKAILSYVKSLLREEYRILKNSFADRLINDFLVNGILPTYHGDNIAYNEYRRNQLIETIKVIYEAEPSIFSKGMGKKQKKIFVKLLDRIVETNSLSNLFDIFEGIVELSDAEINKLAEVIKRSSLSNITKTLTFINERLDILDYFKALLKDEDKKTYEVKHIQKSVEENLWLFGEQYTLLASEEDKFDQALRSFLREMKGFDEEHYNKYSVEHSDKQKEMDIFAGLKGVRYDDKGLEYFHCVVIELKRPSVKLTDKELNQIKTYKNVISSHAEFTNDNTRWDFILVGNDISNNHDSTVNIRDELESNKSHGEFGLIQKSGNKRIYIKTWKQITNEFELRYHGLTDKLKLKELNIQHQSPDALTKQILDLSKQNDVTEA